MNDTSEKSSEELAAQVRKLMPKLESCAKGWRVFLGHPPATEIMIQVAQLVLAQQQEIEQLKAELEELKNSK